MGLFVEGTGGYEAACITQKVALEDCYFGWSEEHGRLSLEDRLEEDLHTA